jgi:hypothetical protein
VSSRCQRSPPRPGAHRQPRDGADDRASVPPLPSAAQARAGTGRHVVGRPGSHQPAGSRQLARPLCRLTRKQGCPPSFQGAYLEHVAPQRLADMPKPSAQAHFLKLRSGPQTERRSALGICGLGVARPAFEETRYFLPIVVGDRRTDVTLVPQVANLGSLVRRTVATCIRSAAVLRLSPQAVGSLLLAGEHQSTGALIIVQRSARQEPRERSAGVRAQELRSTRRTDVNDEFAGAGRSGSADAYREE